MDWVKKKKGGVEGTHAQPSNCIKKRKIQFHQILSVSNV